MRGERMMARAGLLGGRLGGLLGGVRGGLLGALLAARLRHALGARLVVAAGIGVCIAVPVVAAAVAAISADGALRQGLAGLPAGQRALSVSFTGLLDARQAADASAAVHLALAPLTSSAIHRELAFHSLSDGHGGSYTLGAADDLARSVRLVSGRLPRSCTPTLCEVVADAAEAKTTSLPSPGSDTGLVVVGQVRRTDPLLLSGTFDPGQGTLLLADGVDAAAANRALASFQRAFGWTAELDLDTVRQLGVERWTNTATAAAEALAQRPAGLVLIAPSDTLNSENDRATTSAQRFRLLGATSSMLILAVAVVGGAALRRDAQAFAGVLHRRGAGGGLLALLGGGEAVATVVLGVLLGLGAGGVAAAVLAASSGLATGATATAALVGAVPLVLVIALLAGGLLALTTGWPVPAPTGGAPWRLVEILTVGSVGVAVLLAARGGVGTGSVGGDPLVTALPVLVLISCGLVAARIWLPVARALARICPQRAVAARIGLSAAASNPLRPAATCALLAAAVAGMVFAAAYDATLSRGAADQAAFAVPLDARIGTGATLTRPLDVATPAQLAPAGGSAFAVLRQAASIRTGPQDSASVQLLGVDPRALPRIARWSAVAGGDAPTLARAIALDGLAGPGTVLPVGTRLRIATPVMRTSAALDVAGLLRGPDGRERFVPLSSAGGALVGRLPAVAASGGWRLVGLDVREPPEAATHRQHQLGEGHFAVAVPSGQIELGALTVDGRPADPQPWRGWFAEGFRGTGGTATLDYRLDKGVVVVSTGQVAAGSLAVPVIVDEQTARAASGGVIDLVLDGRTVRARVVGTLPRFPTLSGRFAIADVAAVAQLADAGTPGAGQPSEVWLSQAGQSSAGAVASIGAAVAHDRLLGLEVAVRADVERGLRSDPVARGASRLLLSAAAAMFLLGVVALVLLVVTQRRDGAAEAYAWEADGVAPGTLRTATWWHAAGVAIPAVPIGILGGIVLARSTARLVAVTATAQVPQPPLVSGVGTLTAGLAALAAVLLALLLAAAVAATGGREPMPIRGPGAGS